MDAATLDFASSIRYALTARPAADGGVEIVLDLFRGAAPALRRTLASVAQGEAAALIARCSLDLERRGAHAVTHAASASLAPPAPDPAWAAPVAGHGWVFAG